MMKKLLILTSLLGVTGLANAQLVVDFGGEYGYATNTLQADYTHYTVIAGLEGVNSLTPAVPGTRTEGVLLYNSGVPVWQPGVGATGLNGTIYGAGFSSHTEGDAKAQWTDGAGEGGGDAAQIDTSFGPSTSSAQGTLLLWQKADFLNGFAAAAADAAQLSISANLRPGSGGVDDADAGRFLHWVVGDSLGNLYVSEAGTLTATGVAATYTANYSGLTWVAYDPSVNPYINPTGGSIVTPDLTDISSVGLYVRSETGWRMQTRVISFEATAAVPEPSTYAMILGGLSLGFILIRRRMRG